MCPTEISRGWIRENFFPQWGIPAETRIHQDKDSFIIDLDNNGVGRGDIKVFKELDSRGTVAFSFIGKPRPSLASLKRDTSFGERLIDHWMEVENSTGPIGSRAIYFAEGATAPISLVLSLLGCSTNKKSDEPDIIPPVVTHRCRQSVVDMGQSSLFAPRLCHRVSGGLRSVTIGDFNDDNKADLALAITNPYPHDRNVLLGNGDGTFRGVESYDISDSSFVAVADFNGDNRDDLVVTSMQNDSVNVLLGNGDGTFRKAGKYDMPDPAFVAVADFNNDKKTDMVVRYWEFLTGIGVKAGMDVFLGNGDGTFREIEKYDTQDPSSVAVADFNGDNKADLVVANPSLSDWEGSINVLLGSGDGTFREVGKYFDMLNPAFVAVADFNGDNKADMAVTDSYGAVLGGPLDYEGSLNVLLGNGDGTFREAGKYDMPDPAFVAVADFNGDNKVDLVVNHFKKHSANIERGLDVFLGNGDGTFESVGHYSSYPYNASFTSIAVGDLNGDNKVDLVATSRFDFVEIFLNISR